VEGSVGWLAPPGQNRALLADAPVPAVCPAGLESARPALDDLEPWAPGSFDEVVLACDLGILTDDDYEALVGAVSS
jgi:hypothetical protein